MVVVVSLVVKEEEHSLCCSNGKMAVDLRVQIQNQSPLKFLLVQTRPGKTHLAFPLRQSGLHMIFGQDRFPRYRYPALAPTKRQYLPAGLLQPHCVYRERSPARHGLSALHRQNLIDWQEAMIVATSTIRVPGVRGQRMSYRGERQNLQAW